VSQSNSNFSCTVPVTIVQSKGGGADQPVTVLKANGGTFDVQMAPDISTSIKYGKNIAQGVSQFEYFLQPDNPATAGGPTNWWDLSDLDGNVNQKTQAHSSGSPFFNDNVEVKPIALSGQKLAGNCVPLTCPAGQVCKDAYQNPDDKNTRVCIHFQQ
jgi:hypothetical protein